PLCVCHSIVVVARCRHGAFGAVPSDEGRVRCRGRCAPRPFIASASAFLFLHLHIFLLLHDEFVGGALALAPCFMALCLLCRLRFFHAILKRLAAEDLDNVLCAALFSFVIAAAVRLCGCVLVARVASPAVAPLLCWWGNERATALVKWLPSGRRKAPTARLTWTLVPRVWVSPPHFFMLPSVCAVCAYDAAVCFEMPTHVREERRLDCRRTASPPLLSRVNITSSDALDGRRS
ncbi:hypothetical protein TcCL_NonESM12072, partial [Trypanosoma cruzi]